MDLVKMPQDYLLPPPSPANDDEMREIHPRQAVQESFIRLMEAEQRRLNALLEPIERDRHLALMYRKLPRGFNGRGYISELSDDITKQIISRYGTIHLADQNSYQPSSGREEESQPLEIF